MSTRNSNPAGVIILRDNETDKKPRPVWFEFEAERVESTGEREIVGVIVGPPGDASDFTLFNLFLENKPFDSRRDEDKAGSCRSGKASVIFVKSGGSNTVVIEEEVTGALVGITEITPGEIAYPQKAVFSKEFYKFSPANRKAFAKLFC